MQSWPTPSESAPKARAGGSGPKDITPSTAADNTRQAIGERIYSLVQRVQPRLAGRITGMLLELDQAEQLSLLGSPDDLSARIDEALAVLGEHGALPDQRAAAGGGGDGGEESD